MKRPVAVLLVLASAAALAAVVWRSWATPATAAAGYTQHELGPIGPADRAMLAAVRRAGLWEIPVGEEASQRATTTQFRQVGARIAQEHRALDQRVRDVAGDLGVALPDEPTAEQQQWMAEISAASSLDYDRTAVQLLRAAHGKVLPVLAQVRAGSRNTMMRDFAEESAEYVTRHHNYLESTGLVDFAALPEPPAPAPVAQPVDASYFESRDPATLAITALVALLIAAAVGAVVYAFRGRPTPPRTAQLVAGPPRHNRSRRRHA